MIYKILGENIKRERLKLNLTQDQLSEKLDISTSYLGRIERGERNLPLDTLIRISNIFNVSIDYLLRGCIVSNNESISSDVNNLFVGLSSKEMELVLDMVKLMISHFKSK
ncbi:transcriptional regulator [Clostridium beijerinckii]|uniref:Transcriptional regulator n=1 Tax=Clostridium beijerinckii TaxID=1520 RepID=A0A0B5Q736_CLOBE|nr:helix-turn-helix transcriptional regulator [Clostridium beijerinckii]AJG96780.1 transcriptional regulator [Clostridium beijerinckii]